MPPQDANPTPSFGGFGLRYHGYDMARRFLKTLILGSMLLGLLTVRGDGIMLNPAQRAALPYAYNLARWELGNVVSKWTHRLSSAAPWARESGLSRGDRVHEYLRLGPEIAALSDAVKRAAARDSASTQVDQLEAELVALKAARRDLRNDAEEVLESFVSAALAEQGIASWGPFVFPPVDVRLGAPPKALVTSPRDRIVQLHGILIDPEISYEQTERVERQLFEVWDLSGLVEGVGGVATYPASVWDQGDLRWTLKTIAHEWFHQYVVANLKPLGRHFYSSPEMVTLNETAAEIVGAEIADLAVELVPEATSPPKRAERRPAPPPTENGHASFDFSQEMRKTRLKVDDLLAEGRIEDAETYMEERRKIFVENGHPIRKLNQAYFALNGNYAQGPASSSPIGGQLQRFREQMPDLESFVSAMSGVSSYQDFLDMLDEGSVED